MKHTARPSDALPGADFQSPSWQLARFEIETDPDNHTTACWLVAHFPAGVSAKLAYVRDADIGELLLDALTLSQAAYARAKVRSKHNDN
jgi:hypothetical protein